MTSVSDEAAAKQRLSDAGFCRYALDPSGQTFLAPAGAPAELMNLADAVAWLDRLEREAEER